MTEEIRTAIELSLSPGRFFVAGGTLAWEHRAAERVGWEIFRGHLLDQRQTREQAVFESWSVSFHAAPEGVEELPAQHVISLKLAGPQGPIYVTRELWIQGEETYEPAPNVIETRPALIAQRELVGTIDVQRWTSVAELAAELSHYVLLALVGTSRLPITSVESPLPAFSFGQFGYSPANEPQSEPTSDAAQWIERCLSIGPTAGQARVLELALRACQPSEIAVVGRAWQKRTDSLGLDGEETAKVVKQLFNQVALTPYTSLVGNLIALVDQLVELGHLNELTLVGLMSFLLRQLARHLNAYDLVQFHNQGANYPDALLLDALLTRYVSLIERRPEWFINQPGESTAPGRAKQLRRRALRGGCILRRQYAGHAVPDLPTSPGENVRVLAGVAYHVSEDQLTRPATRRVRLFAADANWPLLTQALLSETPQALCQSLDDLDDPQELIELGTGLFLDRPLGLFKGAGHTDRTPLVSYEAFSRQIAAQRLEWLSQCITIAPARREHLARVLDCVPAVGLPADRLPGRQSTGVVILEDAARAAKDFVIQRTTRGSLDELLAGYDLAALAGKSGEVHRWLTTSRDVLLVRTAPRPAADSGRDFLTAFDRQMQRRLKFALPRPGVPDYFERAGSERLQAGLRLTELDGQPCDVPIPSIF